MSASTACATACAPPARAAPRAHGLRGPFAMPPPAYCRWASRSVLNPVVFVFVCGRYNLMSFFVLSVVTVSSPGTLATQHTSLGGACKGHPARSTSSHRSASASACRPHRIHTVAQRVSAGRATHAQSIRAWLGPCPALPVTPGLAPCAGQHARRAQPAAARGGDHVPDCLLLRARSSSAARAGQQHARSPAGRLLVLRPDQGRGHRPGARANTQRGRVGGAGAAHNSNTHTACMARLSTLQQGRVVLAYTRTSSGITHEHTIIVQSAQPPSRPVPPLTRRRFAFACQASRSRWEAACSTRRQRRPPPPAPSLPPPRPAPRRQSSAHAAGSSCARFSFSIQNNRWCSHHPLWVLRARAARALASPCTLTATGRQARGLRNTCLHGRFCTRRSLRKSQSVPVKGPSSAQSAIPSRGDLAHRSGVEIYPIHLGLL